jgi:hypothetical protein
MKSFLTFLLIIGMYGQILSQSACDVLYVTTSGLLTNAGTIANPTTLENAIDSASPGTLIRIAAGTYNIDNAIHLKDSITLEGGFNPTSWVKSSSAGSTSINRTTLNPEGAANSQRLVCMYGNGISGFRLQDITLRTSNANSDGQSTYGLHLTNCSNYFIYRTQILPGNARDGRLGANGTIGGAGSNGDNGTRGDDDNDRFLRQGGSGGNGCSGATGGSTVSSTLAGNRGILQKWVIRSYCILCYGRKRR